MLHGAGGGAGFARLDGVVTEPEADVLVRRVQVPLRAPAGGFFKGLPVRAEEQPGIRGIDGEAFREEAFVFFAFRIEPCQDAGLEAPGLHAVPAADEALVGVCEGGFQVPGPYADAGHVMVRDPRGVPAPRGLIERVEGLRQFPVQFQRQAQTEIRFPGEGVGVAPGLGPDRLTEEGDALPDQRVPEQQKAIGFIQPEVARVAP